jgi:uncharacterized protein YjbJ (UPF0337 family)
MDGRRGKEFQINSIHKVNKVAKLFARIFQNVSNLKNREKNMSTEDRAKATGKNLEGKAQEALGNITGDPEDKAEGKAKQAESQARHAAEDLKDKAKEALE